MNPISGSLVAVFTFGVVFVVALLVLAVKFPRPTPFQYMVFRIVLALAAAGVAALIPGLLQVDWGGIVKAGGALGVFVVIYFFSPAPLVASGRRNVDALTLQQTWAGVRAPDPQRIDADMAHRALNVMRITARFWKDGDAEEHHLIYDECWGPYRQWFIVLDSSGLVFSDGKAAKEHLDGLIRNVYEEMKQYG